MSTNIEAAGVAEAAQTEDRGITEPPGSSIYELYAKVAEDLVKTGLAPGQSVPFLTALGLRRDLMLAGDERSFVKAAIAIPALGSGALVAAIMPTMDALRRVRRCLEAFPIKVASFDLAPTKSDKRAIWEAMDQGEVDVVLISPGRLASQRFRERLAKRPLSMVAVMHGQVMSPWSHRFTPTFRQIGAFIRSMTSTPKAVHIWSTDKMVHQDIQKTLGLQTPYFGALTSDVSLTPHFKGYLVKTDEERQAAMEEFIFNHDCQGVIYVRSVKQLHDTKAWLESLGETPQVSRPGMDEFSLQKARTAFEQGDVRIMISQGAFLSTLERAPGVEFVIYNGMPDSIESLGQELFAQESASPIACLCLSSEHDFYHHRFAIDKNYPDALTLRACFQGARDAFGGTGKVSPETLKNHIRVATPYPEDDILQCLSVMHREGLVEHILDAESDQIMVKLSETGGHDGGFWHEYPLRKLEQIARLEKTRDFVTTTGELGKTLRELLKI